MKKNSSRMVSCGSSNITGRRTLLKCARFRPTSSFAPIAAPRLSVLALVELFELPQDFVAALHGRIHGDLRRLLAREYRVHFFPLREHGLREVAEVEAQRVLGR